MKEMKMFYWKLLLIQTFFYGLFALISYLDRLTKDGELLWIPFVLIFYVISVVCTFILPMMKLSI